ncbi:subtilisin-like protein, partial [Anaeromyces robustus]
MDKIKNETKWFDVSVQDNIDFTPNHLSLISQSPLIDTNKIIDSNYYYPSSAGKGIDIYFIDQGLYTNQHRDFNTEERIITCDAIIRGHNVHHTTDEEKNNCSGSGVYPDHGVMVSSVSGGTIYGVAKKANLHMIAIDGKIINVLRGIDYVLQYGKPHKTIINLSLGHKGYSKIENDKITDLINKGYIIIVSSGNEEDNCCVDKSDENFHSFAGYRKAITVGAVNTELNGKGYVKASYSDYGDCIDIYAPGDVTFANTRDSSDDDFSIETGTSCATPLVAGVAATIMSEHTEIEFDNELMRKTLIEMSIKDVIYGLKDNTPNRFINN